MDAYTAVVVTALVDVGRGGLPRPFGRSFEDEELPLLLRLLEAIRLPVVVYLEPRWADAVVRARGDRATCILPLCREDLRAWAHYDRVQTIRQAAFETVDLLVANEPRYALADHAPFLLSRPSWLARQAEARPFDAEYVFWMDPGLVRTVGVDELRDAVSEYRLVRAAGDRFLIARVDRSDGREAAWSGLFGGRVDVVRDIAERYESQLALELAAGRLPDGDLLIAELAVQDAEAFGDPVHVSGAPIASALEHLLGRPSPRRRDTLVTAAYDLDPFAPLGGRGHSLDFYLPTLRSAARLGAGIVVYTWPRHVARIEEHLRCAGADAVVIGRDLEDVPRYEQIQRVRVEQRFDLQVSRDRCHVLCHAKLSWVAEQVDANPFGSERFYWIDAALANESLFPRRYLADHFGEPCALFTPRVLEGLAAAAAPLVMLAYSPWPYELIHGVPRDVMASWAGAGAAAIDGYVVGGLFGGDGAAVRALDSDFDRALDRMLGENWLGTEENLLTVLYYRNPSRVRLFPFTTWYHEDTDVRPPEPDDVPFYRIFEQLTAMAAA